MCIFLTSTGFSSQAVLEAFKKVALELSYTSAVIITTASEGKSENKYAKLAKAQLIELAFTRVEFVDLEQYPEYDFSHFDVIYVCGGNTFKLLKFAREANLKKSVKELLVRDGTYLGVSAGTIILSPTIEVANEITPDPNEIGLTDLTALNLIPFHVVVHFEESQEKEIRAFEKKHIISVERLSNSQALIISTDKSLQRI